MDYGKPSESGEADSLLEILRQSFNFPKSSCEQYVEIVGLDNLRQIRLGGETVAGLAILPMGQWFGGQCVPMAGIAAVAVAPHHRGAGVALELLRGALAELQERGFPLSVLYPATLQLYRRAGYEAAGSRYLWGIPTRSIQLNDRHLPARRLSPMDYGILRAVGDQRARGTNGNLDRSEVLWKRLDWAVTEAVHTYVFGSEGRPEGYVVFTQVKREQGYDIRIRDLAALTPAAGRRIWTFLADHSSLVQEVVWPGPAVEPLLWFIREPKHRLIQPELWLLRLVHVAKALELRGYPEDAVAELHLEIRDDVLAENSGRYVLSVANGRAEVTRGGRGDLRLDVRLLAPLYTGLLTVSQLRSIGSVDSTADALAAASRLFTGTEPWMPDAF